jgi:hypothetical protein
VDRAGVSKEELDRFHDEFIETHEALFASGCLAS